MRILTLIFLFGTMDFSGAQVNKAIDASTVHVNPAVEKEASTTQQDGPPGGDANDAPFDMKKVLTRFEFWLALLIVFFGTVVVIIQYSLLRKRDFDGNDILKVFGVTLIIVGTLFLIAAGFGDKQIASAMGLFGTLAGYLLGKTSSKEKNEKSE